MCSHSAQGDSPASTTPPNMFQGKPDTTRDSGTIHKPLPSDCKQSKQEGEHSFHLANACWQQAFIPNNHLVRIVLAPARMASQLLTRKRRPSSAPMPSDARDKARQKQRNGEARTCVQSLAGFHTASRDQPTKLHKPPTQRPMVPLR